jgi:hypothetical protein
MYADKPMQGHGLVQAIASVNRVFRDNTGGLVVDYLGLADRLNKALGNLQRERRPERSDLRRLPGHCCNACETRIAYDVMRSFTFSPTGPQRR